MMCIQPIRQGVVKVYWDGEGNSLHYDQAKAMKRLAELLGSLELVLKSRNAWVFFFRTSMQHRHL